MFGDDCGGILEIDVGGSSDVFAGLCMQDERPFVSCKKVMFDMGAPYNQQELVSFHTISKGALGECGIRGGMLEATNIHPETIDQLYKIASINLSPNTFGQVRLALLYCFDTAACHEVRNIHISLGKQQHGPMLQTLPLTGTFSSKTYIKNMCILLREP